MPAIRATKTLEREPIRKYSVKSLLFSNSIRPDNAFGGHKECRGRIATGGNNNMSGQSVRDCRSVDPGCTPLHRLWPAGTPRWRRRSRLVLPLPQQLTLENQWVESEKCPNGFTVPDFLRIPQTIYAPPRTTIHRVPGRTHKAASLDGTIDRAPHWLERWKVRITAKLNTVNATIEQISNSATHRTRQIRAPQRLQ